MSFKTIFLFFLISLTGFGGEALARGDGVRKGDLLIHPSAKIAAGYDSNVFYEAPEEAPNSGSMMMFGGGLELSNRNSRRLSFSLKSDLNFRLMTSLDTEETQTEERTGLESAKMRADLRLFPQSSISLELKDKLSYAERASYEFLADGYQKLENAVGADLIFAPGSRPASRALTLKLGYVLHTTHFLGAQGQGQSRAEKLAHEMELQSRWKFFPKTAAVLGISYSLIDYEQPKQLENESLIESMDRDSSPLRIMAGLEGLITQRVSVVLKGGFSNSFNARGESFQGFIGKFHLQYLMEPTLQLRLGYERDGRDTSFSNYYSSHQFFLKGELFFLNQFSINLKGGLHLYTYAASGSPDEVTGAANLREDPVIRVEGSFTYQLKNWLKSSLVWEMENNRTEWVDHGLVDNPANYSRQLMMLRVSADY